MVRFLLTRRSSLRWSGASGLLALASVGGGATLDSSLESRTPSTSNPLPSFLSSFSTFLSGDETLSISSRLLHCFSSAYELLHKNFVPPLLSIHPAGSSVSYFSVPGSLPPSNPGKVDPGEGRDDSKCCQACLHRASIVNAAAAVSPAVVHISVTYGVYGEMLAKGIGSGTIIDPDGTILTCAHCVQDIHGSRRVSKGKVGVTLQDGREFEGSVVNADLISDVAVVKIKSITPLPAAKLGLSSKVRPGEWAIALGSPHSLQNTITAGIISSVDRKSTDLGLEGIRREYLQTDCAINEGNSGGPLVNLDGEVVGINLMKVKAADGLSFAVPIDSVSRIVEQFRKNGRVIRPWLGVKLLDLNEMNIAHLKEITPSFPDVNKGVLILMITPGSPAENARFQPGDVVIEFDGHPVESIKEIIDIMDDKVGKPSKVLVKRENNIFVTLTVVPEESDSDR